MQSPAKRLTRSRAKAVGFIPQSLEDVAARPKRATKKKVHFESANDNKENVVTMSQSPKKLPTLFASEPLTETSNSIFRSALAKPAKKFTTTSPTKQPVFETVANRANENALFNSPPKRPASPIKGLSPIKTFSGRTIETLQEVPSSSGISGSPRKPLSPIKVAPRPQQSSKVTVTAPKSPVRKTGQTTPPSTPPRTVMTTPAHSPKATTSQSSKIPVRSASKSPSSNSSQAINCKTKAPMTASPSKIPVRSPPVSFCKLASPITPSKKSSPKLTSRTTTQMVSSCKINSPRSVTTPVTPKISHSRGSLKRARTTFQDDHSEDELSRDMPACPDTPSPICQRRRIAVSPPQPAVHSSLSQRKALSMTPATANSTKAIAKLTTPKTGKPIKNTSPSTIQAKPTPATTHASNDPLSPMMGLATPTAVCSPSQAQDQSTPLETAFEDAIAIYEAPDVTMTSLDDSPQEQLVQQSQISDASEEYGDENTMPMSARPIPIGSASNFCTPSRICNDHARVAYTVSKVPLKPPADYEEFRKYKGHRKTKSLRHPLSPQSEFDLALLRQTNPVQKSSQIPRPSKFKEMLDDCAMPAYLSTPLTNRSPIMSIASPPAPTPKCKEAHSTASKLLAGAVVFVDVHTAEGADAGDVFVDLLKELGAKVVKQWNWTLRGSLNGSSMAGSPESLSHSPTGITHVVFKDGSRRTIEKVREAQGLVMCVSVRWLVDCERYGQWMEESLYAVDTSEVPRGGRRRRKSMEPKAVPSTSMSPLKSESSLRSRTIQDYSKLDSSFRDTGSRRSSVLSTPPERSEDPFTTSTPVKQSAADDQRIFTPGLTAYSSFGSPATPYFLHRDQLVQKTCPPKQAQKSFFPISGRIGDEPSSAMRQRLALARRKSLQWAPKIGSPLARTQI